MPSTWSSYAAGDAAHLADLIRRARQVIGSLGEIRSGVFRGRGSLTLYFSPIAVDLIVQVMQLPLVACATPDQMQVEVVAGAYDQVDWYDMTLEQWHDQMLGDYLDELDEHGLRPPEDGYGPTRRATG